MDKEYREWAMRKGSMQHLSLEYGAWQGKVPVSKGAWYAPILAYGTICWANSNNIPCIYTGSLPYHTVSLQDTIKSYD